MFPSSSNRTRSGRCSDAKRTSSQHDNSQRLPASSTRGGTRVIAHILPVQSALTRRFDTRGFYGVGNMLYMKETTRSLKQKSEAFCFKPLTTCFQHRRTTCVEPVCKGRVHGPNLLYRVPQIQLIMVNLR